MVVALLYGALFLAPLVAPPPAWPLDLPPSGVVAEVTVMQRTVLAPPPR